MNKNYRSAMTVYAVTRYGKTICLVQFEFKFYMCTNTHTIKKHDDCLKHTCEQFINAVFMFFKLQKQNKVWSIPHLLAYLTK